MPLIQFCQIAGPAYGATVVVTGGREFDDEVFLCEKLTEIDEDLYIRRLVTGGCVRGADWMAEIWAKWNGTGHVRYPADWAKYGRAAGPIRNAEMLNKEKPDLVVAFTGGAGTADCVAKALDRGIDVLDYRQRELR